MQRQYELGFIIPISVSENETHGVIGTVQEWIKNLEGRVTKIDYWGRRRLAYPIQDFREGYYVFLYMDFAPQNIEELERQLFLSDQVIRHLVVRLDEDGEDAKKAQEKEQAQTKAATPAEDTSEAKAAATPEEKPADAEKTEEKAEQQPAAPASEEAEEETVAASPAATESAASADESAEVPPKVTTEE
ncbi:MAG: 30S ribosomal protein S6 [Chloroflexi bacterium]|nr:30S ribosomal protein S6 [Chloroflexota bacterium]